MTGSVVSRGMRAWIVAFALLAACKSKGKDKDKAALEAAKALAAAPKVTVATVLAKDGARPPFLYLVDDAGTVRLGAAKSWAELDANELHVATKPSPIERLDRYVREEYAFEKDPIEAVASWDGIASGPDLEDDVTSPPSVDQDDPPPPEEEDRPDDGEDESGGTGTAMALEEGKMGKKDSDRAEGQYKMRRNDDDPQLARQQAIEQARTAGILGAGLSKSLPNEDGTPTRVAEVVGAVVPDGKLEKLRAMIVIAPTAKATKLIELVARTDAAIAVSHGGKIRPLNLQFGSRGELGNGSAWIEARVSAKSVVIEAVPDAPIEVSTLDAKQLAAALDKARKARGTDPDAPVDVLVDPALDVQRLIDVVVALDTAGVRVIGMGSMPSTEELARRGHRIPTTALGQPNTQGDLDKAVIRRVVKSSKSKITACYAAALATNPDLSGTVQTQFFINPDGKVSAIASTGVDPSVSDCVAGVVKALTFPKPKGGGGVQVNYPFTMRP